MGRLIYGLILGSLIFALIGCLAIAIGLNALSHKLQTRIITSYLQQDISMLTDSLDYNYLDAGACLATQQLKTNLKNTQLDDIEDVWVFQRALVKDIKPGIDCFHEQTQGAISERRVQAAKTSLGSYAAYLDISARHSFLNLSYKEKKSLEEAALLSRSSDKDEAVLKQIEHLFPILEEIQNNLAQFSENRASLHS